MSDQTPTGPLLQIRWQDHFDHSGWHDEDSSPDMDPLVIQSIGWLVSENEHMLVLKNHVAECSGKTLHSMHILTVCIIDRHEIEFVE